MRNYDKHLEHIALSNSKNVMIIFCYLFNLPIFYTKMLRRILMTTKEVKKEEWEAEAEEEQNSV